MIESALFYQFHIYFSSYGTYTGLSHIGCHQIMTRRPIFSITRKRGQYVQKQYSGGLYILYACILNYVYTLIF